MTTPPEEPEGFNYLPHAPAVSPAEQGTPVPRPATVDRAWLAWLSAAGISLLGVIVGLAGQSAITDAANRYLATQGLQLTTNASGGTASTIFAVVMILLWVSMTVRMRAGANWARITLTVLGGIYILIRLIALTTLSILFNAGIFGVLDGLLLILGLVAVIVAIVFSYGRGAGLYFRQARGYR